MDKRIKIFISYSWSPITNKNWVIDFAERLTRDGLHVIIDEWDAKEGQDKYHFMEQMVNDKSVEKVLLICNKDYSEKANLKKGGVGIESQIISSEIYNNVEQNKFIPIVREHLLDGTPFLPTFVSSRFYIDLSDSENYEENYEQLIRRTFGKPKHKRPPIGEAPSYIKEAEPTFLRTAHKFRPLKESIINQKLNQTGFIKDYFEQFNLTLKDFILPEDIDINKPPIDDVLVEKLEQLKGLRDEYIEIISLYVKYSTINNELIFKIMENAYNSVNFKLRDPYYDLNNHLQLFLNEIFLYTFAMLIKEEKFESAAYIVTNLFAIEKENRELEYQPYCIIFNKHNRVLDEHRKQRLNQNRISISTDLIKERATNQNVSFGEIHDADIILHYGALLIHNEIWFPRLSIYRTNYGNPMIIQRMKSTRYFNKAKVLFGTKTKQELFDKISALDKKHSNGYNRFYYDFVEIFNAFKEENIANIN